MASLPRERTPVYEDQLISWHNQRLWYLLLCTSGIVVILAITICIQAFRPHTQPWVIAVNDKGEPVGNVIPLEGSQMIADSTIRWAIGEFVQNAFRISPNFQQEQALLGRVYSMCSKQAADMLTGYYHANKEANNPLMVGSKFWQEVLVVDTLKLAPKDVYQVDYIIQRHDHEHETNPITTNWRATMRVLQGRPSDKNPLGLWVTDFDFAQEAKALDK